MRLKVMVCLAMCLLSLPLASAFAEYLKGAAAERDNTVTAILWRPDRDRGADEVHVGPQHLHQFAATQGRGQVEGCHIPSLRVQGRQQAGPPHG